MSGKRRRAIQIGQERVEDDDMGLCGRHSLFVYKWAYIPRYIDRYIKGGNSRGDFA